MLLLKDVMEAISGTNGVEVRKANVNIDLDLCDDIENFSLIGNCYSSLEYQRVIKNYGDEEVIFIKSIGNTIHLIIDKE